MTIWTVEVDPKVQVSISSQSCFVVDRQTHHVNNKTYRPIKGGTYVSFYLYAIADDSLSHEAGVNVIAYNHGSKYLLSGSSDRTIRLWNPATGKEVKVYRGQAHEILALDV